MKQVNLRIYKVILPLLLGLFMSIGVYAQQVTVRGHVKDALGEPMMGANVIEKANPDNGTIVDLDGNFLLTVPQGAIIQVSFIGYKTLDLAAAPTLNITM